MNETLIETGGSARSGNPSPYKARLAKKERSKPGSLDDLTHTLWKAIQRLDGHLEQLSDDEEKIDTNELCKLTHALSQSASTYIKIIETGELEARLEALEQAQEAKGLAA
jgi:hypothetical protein